MNTVKFCPSPSVVPLLCQYCCSRHNTVRWPHKQISSGFTSQCILWNLVNEDALCHPGTATALISCSSQQTNYCSKIKHTKIFVYVGVSHWFSQGTYNYSDTIYFRNTLYMIT